ncbi:acyl-CoA dehydrogenase family protein [Tardiphaga sp. 709]|uniref:acyl-CoA dehydrogenase family protein n=1 Tax=Tardiphaga sp. 709 TaxID=3076039 RepID=UPI0028F12CF6|nr:acyl-CoA dehydrogenase family protein [Tardiphaga sp. 709]WNV11752.1 acyl-CoA dehydrogenase family protein [Tardiphaga sp. 709]
MSADYRYHADVIRRHIALVPGYDALRQRLSVDVDVGADTLAQVLDAAAVFAEDVLAPINRAGDLEGCRFQDGRVLSAPGYSGAWKQLAEAGWLAVDQPAEYGGQGLPSFVNAACRELFDCACMAIGMLSGPTRAATQVLLEFGEKAICDEWIPRFVTGEWSATICISEADAGSDVGRIRSRALPAGDGSWLVTGEKMWTSFGDNDLVERIGHFLLARTPDAPPGSAGLSLFLVPNRVRDADGDWVSNGVTPRRIEEKLGLHGSPTCAMGFEQARAHLIGHPHRGLSQMFVMIQGMRLMVAIEGVGMAFGAVQMTQSYAETRKQGGDPAVPPVPIARHADIQRQILGMASRVEVLRGLVYEIAVRLDAERMAVDEPTGREATRSRMVTQWLLPIIKASCAEAGFEVPNEGIQVLGGAGYTREWPLEQWMRDARMMSIAEGSTGIQALDLVHRRLRRDRGESLAAFLDTATGEIASADPGLATSALSVLDRLRKIGAAFLDPQSRPRDAEAGAVAFLNVAMLAATAWIAVRLASDDKDDAIAKRLAACGRYWLSDVDLKAAQQEKLALIGAARLAEYEYL